MAVVQPLWLRNEDVPALPDGWQALTTAEATEQLKPGKLYDQKTSQAEGVVPVVNQSMDGFVGYHSDEPGVSASESKPVVTFANHTCAMRLMKQPFSCIQNIFPKVGRRGVCDTRYFYYAAMGRVGLSDYKGHHPVFRQAYIPVPPLSTQQRIAAILSAYDDLIENNTHRIAILEEMARRLYEEWFIHFRFPGYEEAEFEVVGQRRLPTGWSFVGLDTLFDTSAGGTPSRKHAEYFGGTVQWVKSKELLDAPIFDTEETITEEGLKRSSAKVFPRNTILVAMYGANIGQLGVLRVNAATNQAVCGVLPAEGECGWCYAFLTLLQRRSELVDLRAGAAQQNISQSIIRKFPILRADAGTHKRFEEAVEPLLSHSFVLHRKNANLRAQRDMLLPKLISGEIDVTYTLEAAKEAAE